ncbi:MAG: carboxypeptidase regulatory-like domain-containing protein, partial [Acidobacteria bacterium]|nr:carboxypeptidase regulatory-like domain-containing protein [Acidobacteriota bacterium]
MKKHFAVLLAGLLVFLSFVSRVQAQGEGAIHGIVVAKADGSALPDAAVRLQGLSVPSTLQTGTAGDGHFGFQRLVPGEYVLIVVRQNFLEERVQFTLKPREVKNITLELSLQPVVETVEVTTEAETVATTYSPSSTTLQKQTFEA